MDSAVRLFDQKGYDAVGVREIAAAADVNISMISYYFGGKTGILVDIIEDFYGGFLTVARRSFGVAGSSPDPAVIIRTVIADTVRMLRESASILRIVVAQIRRESPELADLRQKVVRLFTAFSQEQIHPLAAGKLDDERLKIVATAFLGMVFFYFLHGPLFEGPDAEEQDQAFTERYVDTLARLFTEGVLGLVG